MEKVAEEENVAEEESGEGAGGSAGGGEGKDEGAEEWGHLHAIPAPCRSRCMPHSNTYGLRDVRLSVVAEAGVWQEWHMESVTCSQQRYCRPELSSNMSPHARPSALSHRSLDGTHGCSLFSASMRVSPLCDEVEPKNTFMRASISPKSKIFARLHGLQIECARQPPRVLTTG